MTREPCNLPLTAERRRALTWLALFASSGPAWAVNLPVTEGQRSTAQQVAQAGVPLAELAANAPDQHVVQRGDTLWDISKLFLAKPWRWPELWGMNLEQIRNPHLIYPGQVLVLVKSGGRARLQLAGAGAGAGSMDLPAAPTVRLSPRVRAEGLPDGAIAAIPLHLIGPFLNEAVVLEANELDGAPRVVATQEGRVLLSKGETAYVRGDLRGARDFRLFREARPLRDPHTQEVLGWEGAFVGTASFTRAAEQRPTADGKSSIPVPASFTLTSSRLEAGVGDRLSPVPQRDYAAYVPRAPGKAVDGRIVSIYGDGMSAGQNQIVAINRGQREGLERGHVLALWRAGLAAVDRTDPGRKTPMQLPDERVGLMFVFRVFERVSYALILNAVDPVKPGDRFSQP